MMGNHDHDFLHVNRLEWDIPPCQDEIDVTVHAMMLSLLFGFYCESVKPY